METLGRFNYLQLFYEIRSQTPKTVHFKDQLIEIYKTCDSLRSKKFNLPLSVSIVMIFEKKLRNFDLFETSGKLKFFEPKLSHHFVNLDEWIFKMYTFGGFEILFHKITLKKWKNFVL